MRHPLIPISDIPQEGTATAELLGREVLVMLMNGKPRAFVNVCMHHGGPLELEGDRFTCQWHGAQYDARTGLALSGPVRPDARLIMLPTRVEEGILVYAYVSSEWVWDPLRGQASQWESKLTLPVSKDRDHIQGLDDARVTLVEYGDYECPYCGEAYPIVKDIQERLGEQLRFVFRNFPISTSHPHAEHAAEAAEAAAAQGRFWEMHDHLYENQRHLLDDQLRSYAQAVDLDLDLFDKELAEHVHADRVHEDFMSGVRSGVNGTPTFFINGLRHDDSYESETLLLALQRAAEIDAEV